MKRALITYNLPASLRACAPVGSGGNFNRARNDPQSLILELHAEQEEIRSQRRVVQERLTMRTRQMNDCKTEDPRKGMKEVYGWLTGAAVALIFGLLFSAGAMSACGGFGRYGVSSLLFLVGVVLGLRAWGEYGHVDRDRKNHTNRIEEYSKECEQLNEQLYKLNLT